MAPQVGLTSLAPGPCVEVLAQVTQGAGGADQALTSRGESLCGLHITSMTNVPPKVWLPLVVHETVLT